MAQVSRAKRRGFAFAVKLARMVACVLTAAQEGLEGTLVRVEAARQNALPAIQITGLPGDVVRESRERVRVCLENLGFKVPSERIVVHLSPAYCRKQGSHFDLAIALSVLAAEDKLTSRVSLGRVACLGELGLDGKIHRIRGSVALLEALDKSDQVEVIVVPSANADEAALIDSKKFRLASCFTEVLDFLQAEYELKRPPKREFGTSSTTYSGELDTIVGHAIAKRALSIAIAGRHHLLFLGSPGVGKTLLAHGSRSLLPPLDRDETVQVTKNWGLLAAQTINLARPFRSPHHSTSSAAIIGGGGGTVLPGEVTLAHAGILFLDEFPEFRRDVIEGLREPLERGVVHVHRLGVSYELPARFSLIAAMNPCPCGHALNPNRRCSCAWEKVKSYRKRISGAILDRIDMGVVLTTVASGKSPTENSLREAVTRARERQMHRWKGRLNGDLPVRDEEPAFALGKEERAWLSPHLERGELSHRGLHKLIRVARTIADLEENERLSTVHLAEAWSLRCPDLSTLDV